MLLSRKIWGNSCSLTSGTKNAALFYLFTHKYNLVMLPKKFDLRIYVLVTSYRPLKVWLSSQGFARFCNEKYSYEIADMDNMMAHLTNVAI